MTDECNLTENLWAPAPIAAFTYFEDRYGIIYYSHGMVRTQPTLEVRATAVYFPGRMDGQPQRVSWVTGQSYFKFITAGLREEQRSWRQLPADGHRDALSSRLRRDPRDNENYIAVPGSEIRACFSPWEARETICPTRTEASKAPTGVRQAVSAVLAEISSIGIPRTSLGLYGGLQCGIAMADGTVHDVDVLVSGNSHYRTIVEHCSAKEFRWIPDDRVAASRLLMDYERRRVRISQSHTSTPRGEILIDIRLLPTKHDHDGAQCAAKRGHRTGEVVQLRGRVVDASASLSLPACFVVAPLDGSDLIHVVSGHHHLVAAANDGDIVDVLGVRGRDSTVHVIDEERHGLIPRVGAIEGA